MNLLPAVSPPLASGAQLNWSQWTTASLAPAPDSTVFLLGLAEDQLGTGTWSASLSRPIGFVLIDSTTASPGPRSDVSQSVAGYVHELRRLSGLTWQELSELFAVSRRTMHLWASGKAMTLEHEKRLHRICAVLRHIDRGESRVNRHALLHVGASQLSPFELLREGLYEKAKSLAGRGVVRPERRQKAALSFDAQQERTPRHPAELLQGSASELSHRELSRGASRRLRTTK
jgi:hypothetical protein